MKVNLMIVGAMKCGTTTLAELLNHHPSVSVAKNKEPHYFSQESWKNGIEKYHELFDASKPIWCDASTSYTCFPEFNLNIWEDIFEYNPYVKFIYIVRDPLERIVSNYMHLYERGYIDNDFQEALINVPSIINRGKYYMQIKPYIDVFGSSNVLILKFSDLKSNPLQVIEEVCSFVRIEKAFYAEVDFSKFHSNKSLGKRKRYYKYDGIEKKSFIKLIKKLSPRLYSLIDKNIFHKSERGFKEKPVLTTDTIDIIRRNLETDLRCFQTLSDKDFSTWLPGEEKNCWKEKR